ncbi:MAG TPA: hypothetical protein DCF63_00290, partial [Planctomycetaceae bacterium]|nr:hypothetical protein [Planctomycetaceae bacterium]
MPASQYSLRLFRFPYREMISLSRPVGRIRLFLSLALSGALVNILQAADQPLPKCPVPQGLIAWFDALTPSPDGS